MRTLSILGLVAVVILSGFLPSQAAEPVSIVIVHTNDIHGGIDRQGATFMSNEFPPQLGGGASLATLVKSLRAEAEREGKGFLLIDTGDIWQGTPVGNYDNGRVVMDFMNRLGYDVWSPGNHEFDAGLENAYRIMKMAEFPVIAANVVNGETGEIPPPAKPYVILEVAGIKIGMIGLVTEETLNYALPEDVKEVEFLKVKPVTEKYIAEIEDKVDLIFVVGHLGVPYDVHAAYKEMIETGVEQKIRYGMNAMELAHHVEGIDFMACGHIHVGYERCWEDPLTHTVCIQGYGRGTGVGVYELLVDPETKQIIGYDFAESDGGLLTLFEDEWWPDEEMAEFIEEYVDSAEVGMDVPIGRALIDISRVGVGESPMGNMVVDAMREAVDADVAFTNLGGIRDHIGMGIITPRDVFQVVPFDNKITVFEMTGSFLKHVLEWRVKGMRQGLYISGVKAAFSRTRPDFDRVVELKVGGELWDPEATYRVATTDFIAQGNVGLQILTDVSDEYVEHTGVTVKDAVIEYVKRHSPLAPKVEGRFKRDDDRDMSPELAKTLVRYKALDELTH